MQGNECNDKFGGIAESRVKKPADTFAQTRGKLLGGPTQPTGERQDSKA